MLHRLTLLATVTASTLIHASCLAQQTPDQKKDTALAPPKGLKTKLPPGYTIPIVDISAEKDRQVIVDREAGQYLGHPTTLLLEDNKTMLIVYPKSHGRGTSPCSPGGRRDPFDCRSGSHPRAAR